MANGLQGCFQLSQSKEDNQIQDSQIVVIKNMKTYQSFSKPLFYVTFALVVVAWILALVLIILVGVFGFVGYNGTTQISAICSDSYYATKYSSVTHIIKTCFTFSVVAIVLATALLVTYLILLIKFFKQDLVAFRGKVKVLLYVTTSLLILSATVPAGYFLTFSQELVKCELTSYNSGQITAVYILALLLVFFSLVIWVLFMLHFFQKVNSQEKYREVNSNTNQTEPVEEVKPVKRNEEYRTYKEQPYIYEKRPQEKQKTPVYRLEQTQQNLYESPSRKPMVQTYSKDPQPSIGEQPNTYTKFQSKKTIPVEERNRQPEPIRYTPNKINNNDDQGLKYWRERRNPASMNKDQQAYKQMEKQYLNGTNQRRGILPSSGLEEREYKGSEYFRSGGENRSPPRKPEREGVLLNYIRGKYAG